MSSYLFLSTCNCVGALCTLMFQLQVVCQFHSKQINYLFLKKISKIVGSFLVCIETFDRNVSSVRHWFTNSSIFVPFLLFRRNGNGSITSDSRFHVRFALVSISTQTATLYSIDYWIFAYWFPFLWTGTNVLHHGKLFRGKFFFEYN